MNPAVRIPAATLAHKVVRAARAAIGRAAGRGTGANGNEDGNEDRESDRDFLDWVFRELLQRPVDPEGERFYLRALSNGMSRAEIAVTLARSDEYVNRVAAETYAIQSLLEVAPAKYHKVAAIDGQELLVFEADTAADFDWIESAILEYGYYSKPGIWGFNVDADKRLMAEIMASFKPARALDIGCANGTVIKALDDLGVACEGVEISRTAVQRAFPEIKDRIHLGDILDLILGPYDLVFGLDIFEHFNPNKLLAYLERLERWLQDGGFLFANIPAFGPDPVFGTVFGTYIPKWDRDRVEGRLFSSLHVDDSGYPLHGHLIWADSAWWVRQFEETGLQRIPEIERALHGKYDEYMRRASPSRAAYYVFGKHADPEACRAVAERVRATGSAVLEARD